ncbi:type I restriction endonuclease subunit S [Butyricicoccus faecihominis]|nr:restriction endonuclease subunit S [Butyricicoccus faecihominis]MBT9817134.1 type I restriction endonuclease subunit S [Butyricicoccus faecihominis]
MELIEFGSIMSMTKGKKPRKQSKECTTGYFPYVDIKAFETGVIENYTDGEKCLPCNAGDILIVCDGSRSGLVGKAINGYVGSTLAKISAKGMLTDYLFYFLQGQYALLNTKKRGTGTPHLNPELLKKQNVYVPSVEKQRRIISRIEELFSELDKGVETLQTIKQQLTVYRQAVLKEAFEGKLTSSWRKKHPSSVPKSDLDRIKHSNETFKDTSGDENEIALIIPNTWQLVRLGEVFEVQVGATPSRRIPAYWNGNINWISSGEVRFNNIFHTNEKITSEGLAHASTNVHPAGTVMLAMIGEGKTRGQAAILNTEAAHNQNTAAILVSNTPCSSKYLYYFLQLNYENTRRVGSGNNQKALNKERVRALKFPFTSFEEQYQIVTEIESRLSACDSIEQTVDKALTQAEAMRQSILKKAFEGKL